MGNPKLWVVTGKPGERGLRFVPSDEAVERMARRLHSRCRQSTDLASSKHHARDTARAQDLWRAAVGEG